MGHDLVTEATPSPACEPSKPGPSFHFATLRLSVFALILKQLKRRILVLLASFESDVGAILI
jgi:hypothetical protein